MRLGYVRRVAPRAASLVNVLRPAQAAAPAVNAPAVATSAPALAVSS